MDIEDRNLFIYALEEGATSPLDQTRDLVCEGITESKSLRAAVTAQWETMVEPITKLVVGSVNCTQTQMEAKRVSDQFTMVAAGFMAAGFAAGAAYAMRKLKEAGVAE